MYKVNSVLILFSSKKNLFCILFYFMSRIFSLLSMRGSATAVTNCFLCHSGRKFYLLLANTLTMNSTKGKNRNDFVSRYQELLKAISNQRPRQVRYYDCNHCAMLIIIIINIQSIFAPFRIPS